MKCEAKMCENECRQSMDKFIMLCDEHQEILGRPMKVERKQ